MNTHPTKALLAAFLTYLIWGFFPLYWKLLQALPAHVILAYRILFALIFVLVVLALRRSLSELWGLFSKSKTMVLISLAAVLICINWGVFIWAVNASFVVETSFGYYINPLVSIVIGLIFFRERLNVAQTIAVACAGIGVLVMGIEYARIPWIALSLALSFGLYGLIKKIVGVSSLVSLGMETLLSVPFALMVLLVAGPHADPTQAGPAGWVFVAVGGAVTAIPLMLFGYAASRIPLSVIGFIQYLTPTISLLLAVLVYHEPFSLIQFLSFTCIWLALGIFSFDQIRGRFRA